MSFSVDKNKIARNTFALYIRLGITTVISFFTVRVTLEQLGVDDYGLNNLVASIVSMLSFLNGSMGTAVQRFYSIEIGKKNESELSKIFGVGLSLHLIVALVTFILAECFAIFFLHKMNIPIERLWAAKIVFQLSIFSFLVTIINVPYAAMLRAREKFTQTAIADIAQAFLRLGVLYLLIIIDADKLVTLGFLNFGVTLIYISFLTKLAWQFQETHILPSWDSALIKKMLNFISMLVLTVLAQLAKVQGIVFLINIFFGLAVNAAYAIAVQVSHLITHFAASFKQSMVPQLMASYGAGDLKTMSKIVNMGTKVTFLLMLLMTLPLIFEAQFILGVWLKEPPQYAVELVVLTLIYINISSFTYFQYQGVHATGAITRQQIWISLSYALNIVLIFISFKFGGSFYSAIYINMFISAVQCAINLYYARINFGYDISYFLKGILFPSLSLLFIVLPILLLISFNMNESLVRFVSVLLVSTTLVSVLGYKILLNHDERVKCIHLIESTFRRKRVRSMD